MDEKRKWFGKPRSPRPRNPSKSLSLNGSGPVDFVAVFADRNDPGSELKAVISEPGKGKKRGWAVGPEDGKTHYLTLLPAQPLHVPPGSKLEVVIDQFMQREHAPPCCCASVHPRMRSLSEYAGVPDNVLDILTVAPEQREQKQRESVADYYRRETAPALKTERSEMRKLKKDLANMPRDTVPIMREMTGEKRRVTHVQVRGNYQALTEEVSEAVPACLSIRWPKERV